jgi:hypothetical protein
MAEANPAMTEINSGSFFLRLLSREATAIQRENAPTRR